ncbi:glycosyltransferase family 1 protein [Ignavibacterium sp.]|uniref:glycosyltransferase family 4 protein n=1 Tax=Ignavibacterium sp. TaxID=2651167 RepID=UPI00220CC3DA|nr:glycosyltransferase family 1 protein [Ignavibacterium sp.]BDQ03132.1 MAG: mannosyltransferase [Ignavibacterium sp.]
MLKVLYDHQCFSYQEYGGVSRYFVELIKHLNSLYFAETDLSIKYSNNQYLNEIDRQDIKKFLPRLKFKGKTSLLSAINKNLSKLKLAQQNYDVFHPTYYDPYFLDNLSGKSFVLTVHDMIHELFPNAVSRWDKTSQHKRILVKEAKKIICVSENTKNDLVRILNADEKKIFVIYHANSLKYNRSKKLETELNLPKRFLLYVGSRKYYKNFTFMTDAIADLLKHEKDLYLICAGGGNFSKKEINFFKELNIESKIKQIPVNDDILGMLYTNALAFIFPSLYEGFGIPVLESFYCGCPVICSNSSSLPEIAENAAEYFEPTNKSSIYSAVGKILNDKQRREELKTLGAERLKYFNWETSALQTYEVYKNSLK